MALLNPTFVFGVVVLTYLSSFVLFALLRIVTGISIQRIGYFSLRRLAYTPRDGCRVEIRGLGFSIHRPTFAQPTWLSLVLNELVVTLDIRELEAPKPPESETADCGGPDEEKQGKEQEGGREEEAEEGKDRSTPLPKSRHAAPRETPGRSHTWKTLTKIKERIKRLHRKVEWLRMVDVVATNSTINVVDVGHIQVGGFTMAVDTRRKMVDRARYLFQRPDAKKQDRHAEWIITGRSILFTAEGKESLEVLDHAILSIHGYLYESKEGLRDATVSLKLGRVHIPYDDLRLCMEKLKACRQDARAAAPAAAAADESAKLLLGDVMQEVDEPGSTSDHLMQTVSDSKEFFSSTLRGIKEVQFAASFISFSMAVSSIKPGALPLQLNAAMKEVGIDLHRLDPKSPAHRMYFPSKDIAHEGLAAALSISFGMDDGHGKPERLLYIPMATTTVRTTLPSKTVELAQDGSSLEEKNANILFNNSVITSPSLDLDPRHLPILIALLKPKPKPPRPHEEKRRSLIPRLLPKASIKVSMHEPVMRIKLTPLKRTSGSDDFDLIISSISSISVDLESSHSPVEESYYALSGSMRMQSSHLYYQTNERERFNLITTDSFDSRIQLSATPDLSVDITGNLQSFSISMIRPEITDGLRQIVKELRIDVEPEKRAVSRTSQEQSFLRSSPQWLSHYHIEATDVNIEVAGVDEDVSDDTRGVSLHLDTLAAEYTGHKVELMRRRVPRTRTHSRSITQSDSEMSPPASSPRPRKKPQHYGDGRRLVIHSSGIEAQIIESVEKLEAEPFLNLPRLELAFSALSDNNGPTMHVQSNIRSIFAHYSLYRHYSVGVAAMILLRAFMKTGQDAPTPKKQQNDVVVGDPPPESPGPLEGEDYFSSVTREMVTVDVKVQVVQVKAEFPDDPVMMLHVFGLEAGQSRWAKPFLTSKLFRLYVEPPRMSGAWARMVSVKQARVDIRKSKRKTASREIVEETMVDISSEAARIGVPHEVIVHRITDNFVNAAKAIEQLHHRFKTGTNEYVLDKHPEGPKKVPKVSIRTRKMLFELEDGAFEWKLGLIYRTGRIEQQQRLAREEAFRAKIKRVRDEEGRRGNPAVKARSRSAFQRGRTSNSTASWFRSRSLDVVSPTDSSLGPDFVRIPRYNPDSETIGINGDAKVTERAARSQLDRVNQQSWKKRIDKAYEMSRNSAKELRSSFWGDDTFPDEEGDVENILEVPMRPALMCTMISDLRFSIDKPSFPMSELPDFLHKVGKGMPRSMKYGLLVPMSVAIEMGEARVSLRDYPLPLLHIPALQPGQSSKMQSVSLKTDFVIAEEYRGVESTRRVQVEVVPARRDAPPYSNAGRFAIEVRRTVGPVKSFSDVYIDINTALPTRITWGPCYQPAIQDMMMAIESFTKPRLDPSESVGFWDKLRLVFHSRIHVTWRGDGDMHLGLRGTHDPYNLTKDGAGFIMCWRNNVRWNINAEGDAKRFMTVDSGEYVLAIPDYTHQVRNVARQEECVGTHLPVDGAVAAAVFKKVVMKLSGNVQWMCGLSFEQAIEDGRRNFEFKPHYDVVIKSPQYAKSENGLPYDAMRGFRSRHLHLSIAVRAPADRDWTTDSAEPSTSYNAVHLTPRFFTHFFAWWALFGQPISLPIRQGALFPGREKSSKKFGRHLATVKYSLLLAPLFLSHIYKHKDAEEYSESAVSATGLKVRLDSFMLDLHQRREEFDTLGRGKNTQSRASRIKIHAGQLSMANADLRAVSASLKGTTTEAMKRGSISALIANQDDRPDLSRFTIPDNDYSWIDMDDFVELDWILPTEPHPHTQILPLGFAPRLTYFRQTDIDGTIAGDPSRTSPFGNEPTHFCIMSQDEDPKKVQVKLVEERLEQLRDQMQTHTRNVGEAELRVIKGDGADAESVAEFEALRRHTTVLEEKKAFLEDMLQQIQYKPSAASINLKEYLDPSSAASVSRSFGRGGGDSSSTMDGQQQKQQQQQQQQQQEEPLDIPTTTEFESEFKNRFILHNMQLKWNNVLRNIVLRYIHQNSQRRGLIYYLSRPAIKFILDLVEEQNRAKMHKPPARAATAPVSGLDTSQTSSASSDKDSSGLDIEDRIKDILGDGRRFHSTSFSTTHGDSDGAGGSRGIEDLAHGISDEFSPQSSYHVRLIAPQIQLQSEKNKKNVVLVTAKGMELKVVEVMDKKRLSDTVSGLVQRRFLVNMDSTQFFVTHNKWFMTNLVSMYAGSRYGAVGGSSWPPWVPMEVMFDFQAAPFGFKRVVEKTSAVLRYDKFNTLRLKYNAEVGTENQGPDATSPLSPTSNSGNFGNLDSAAAATASSGPTATTNENRMDNLWVEFPQVRALCNSSQYYAMYVIVLDLLMYSEPLEKTRTERLEKIMLASDFSDLSGAPATIHRLQERIRQMGDIKTHFQVYSKYLDKRGWEDRLSLERDLAAAEDELFFVMKAITSSQRRFDLSTDSNALLKWNILVRDIVWHLMQDSNEPLVELQLNDLIYDRTDNSDGSHMNLIRVGKILGLNLLPDASYPAIIAPYEDSEKAPPATPLSGTDGGGFNADGGKKDMIRVYWYKLEAIAGITVMDRFEVDLFPMRVQLEYVVGKRLMHYIFPGLKGDDKKDEPSTPASDGRGDEDNDSNLVLKITDDDDDFGNGNGHNDNDAESMTSLSSHLRPMTPSRGGFSSNFTTRPGSLELRLQPTLTSHNTRQSPTSSSRKSAGGNVNDSHYGFRLFRQGTGAAAGSRAMAKKSSLDSLRALSQQQSRGGAFGRSSTGLSSRDSRESPGADGKKRFGLRNRNHGGGGGGGETGSSAATAKRQQAAAAASDDLTKMIARASNYITFSYVRMQSVVLCLSYKGREQRNFADVHDFVFRMPVIEWQNKVWSNVDLAMAFKKAVIRALLSHTGAIIGNNVPRGPPTPSFRYTGGGGGGRRRSQPQSPQSRSQQNTPGPLLPPAPIESRPQTSHSSFSTSQTGTNGTVKRSGAAAGLRDRISAFTQRMSNRDTNGAPANANASASASASAPGGDADAVDDDEEDLVEEEEAVEVEEEEEAEEVGEQEDQGEDGDGESDIDVDDSRSPSRKRWTAVRVKMG
ncbi:RNA pol II promoter Fmp27 protein domain [Geosmithia morbida]|uniref:RNA pol II promoter Fmp27 protein domain n=1 Tax=Geosmithia morbida TaxID=1094350 RepID=A0A9P4YRC1_9HYPO|nr:RNA pol II promoter Fmp27 protein domain [Geosmithia morbida]KAF4120369.1 RNA pol II promoter Fmp27 protein domain [Geosmithia morbida]